MIQFDLTIALEYDLVSSTNRVTFVAKVNEQITEGWQPLGGPFVYKDEVYQAMVREKPRTATALASEMGRVAALLKY